MKARTRCVLGFSFAALLGVASLTMMVVTAIIRGENLVIVLVLGVPSSMLVVGMFVYLYGWMFLPSYYQEGRGEDNGSRSGGTQDDL